MDLWKAFPLNARSSSLTKLQAPGQQWIDKDERFPRLSPSPTAGCVGESCTTASPFGWKLRHCSTPCWPNASESTAQWKSWRTIHPGKSVLARRGCCWGSGEIPLVILWDKIEQ